MACAIQRCSGMWSGSDRSPPLSLSFLNDDSFLKVKLMADTAKNLTTLADRLALAQRLYQEFYAFCFWRWKPDLQVTEENLPSIIDGLQRHGGRKGLLAAAQLAGELPCR